MNEQKNKILSEVYDAIEVARKHLANTPEDNLMQSILAQLRFIEKDLTKGVPEKDHSKRNEIIIGIQSIRELDDSFPELANLLCEIDYEYKTLYGLNII